MSHRVAHVTEVPAVPSPVEGLVWRPVRHHLDVRAFGTNAYTGADVGDLVVEPHEEDAFEELYVVLSGGARFTVDDETFDAPAGSLVLVTPPSHRVAHATTKDTTILAVGAVPGRAFEVSGWESRWLERASSSRG